MTGSFGDMGNLLKQAQEMQRNLDRVKEELKAVQVEGTAGAGVIRIHLTGEGEALKVEIAPAALEGSDVTALEDLVLAALRDGAEKVKRLRDERLSKVTGGLNLPGLF